MEATKNILYHEGAYFDYIFEEGVYRPVNIASRPYGYKDIIYVEVRQYVSDDGNYDTILETEFTVDGNESKRFTVLPYDFNDANQIRVGISTFDELVKSHPKNGAKVRGEK